MHAARASSGDEDGTHQGQTCEMLGPPLNPLAYLGVSVLYIYTHLDILPECSGSVQSVKLCYIMRVSTGQPKEVATILLLSKDPMTVMDIIPIIVYPDMCENEETFQVNGDEMCCVSRDIDPSLSLHASKGELLNFLFALKTPAALELGLGAYYDSRVHGFRLPVSEYHVGSVIPPEHAQNGSIVMGMISFVVQGIINYSYM